MSSFKYFNMAEMVASFNGSVTQLGALVWLQTQLSPDQLQTLQQLWAGEILLEPQPTARQRQRDRSFEPIGDRP